MHLQLTLTACAAHNLCQLLAPCIARAGQPEPCRNGQVWDQQGFGSTAPTKAGAWCQQAACLLMRSR